jgi:energy-coupling factor transporter ATP-binding protein EcfA2
MSGAPTLIDRTVAAVAALEARNPVVLIDGPSGAGKSTLADALRAQWPTDASPELVRLDDLYPGWGGLALGSHAVATELLGALRAEGTGRWRSWDWAAGHPGEWHEVHADRPLIVEGCGALSQASARLAELRVWIAADDAVRKRRALARDHGAFDAHWDMWDAQFAEFVRGQHPVALADLVLDATPAPSPVSQAGARFAE